MGMAERRMLGSDNELARPEEEEYLLPHSRNGKGKVPPKPAPGKAAPCKLPWFGSWSATLLVWVVSTNSLIFWSLPSPTFVGKLTVVRRLWSVNQIYQEDEDLKGKLKKEEERNAELQRGVGNMEEMKEKAGVAETETTRLRAQLKDVQSSW